MEPIRTRCSSVIGCVLTCSLIGALPRGRRGPSGPGAGIQTATRTRGGDPDRHADPGQEDLNLDFELKVLNQQGNALRF
ncbi:hypothetical protein EYF80_056622 [Liparis tanakae]|uniref:Uncharacterized protein n=1 Tax=Liparis tanakae TaxID=230148 RepID=A0A4Z2EY05_9TELE|nr:hypothetical protein EYF80_056622 [Liparis tanakae]